LGISPTKRHEGTFTDEIAIFKESYLCQISALNLGRFSVQALPWNTREIRVVTIDISFDRWESIL
jgi:hypothetical protein